MAETGVENRIMGDLNAYSPEVSGEFPASPFSPQHVDITLVWFKLLWALCSLWSQRSSERANEQTNERTNDRTNEQMNERTNERTNE